MRDKKFWLRPFAICQQMDSTFPQGFVKPLARDVAVLFLELQMEPLKRFIDRDAGGPLPAHD
jgi:hypothetical protein